MYCNKCGNYIDENSGAKFCEACGNDVRNVVIGNVNTTENVVVNNPEPIREPVQQNTTTNTTRVTSAPRRKSSDALAVIACMIFSIVTVIVSIIVVFVSIPDVDTTPNYNYSSSSSSNYSSSKSKKSKIVGTKWEQYSEEEIEDGMKQHLEINKDGTFRLYTEDETIIDIKGTYEIEEEESEMYDKYTLTMTTTDRTVQGQKYTDEYTTKYSIVIEGNEMVFMNAVTYNYYYFVKK